VYPLLRRREVRRRFFFPQFTASRISFSGSAVPIGMLKKSRF
jgi:hypothetical protein